MKIINETLLDSVCQQARQSERKRMNYNFHHSLDENVQRMLNAMEIGTMLPIHRHKTTDETYILLKGKIKVIFYDNNKNITEYETLDVKDGKYGIHIPKNQWHTIEVLENDSVIFEVKEGPYMPIREEDIMHI